MSRRPGCRDFARAIESTDFLRRSTLTFAGLRGYKEWHHFLIQAGPRLVLINFSFSDECLAHDGVERSVGRLKFLEYDGVRFSGDLVVFDAEQLRGGCGSMEVGFGANTIQFVEQRYQLSLELEDQDTTVELTLLPESLPLLTNNLALAPGRPLCWLAVHRLSAWGLLRRGGTTHSFQGAAAYHDHNWGYFRWGDDFIWEWGTLLPQAEPTGFSMSMVRILDRKRTRVTLQSVYLWQGARLVYMFRDREIVIEQRGRAAVTQPYKIPKVMALLHPDTATDVPAEVSVHCQAGDITLRVELELIALAQILMPDELGADSVTILNQCSMRARLEGNVGKMPIVAEAPGVFEFIRA